MFPDLVFHFHLPMFTYQTVCLVCDVPMSLFDDLF